MAYKPHPKPLGRGDGLPPESACYATQTDHRAQVERAKRRRDKHSTVKQRRILDRRAIADPDGSVDVLSMSNKPLTSYAEAYENKRPKVR